MQYAANEFEYILHIQQNDNGDESMIYYNHIQGIKIYLSRTKIG